MKFFIFSFIFTLSLLFTNSTKANLSKPLNGNGLLSVYLECNSCDLQYIRESVSFVNFVRDKELAHIHIIIIAQGAGVSGVNYIISFFGKDAYEGYNSKITFWAPRTNTNDETRKGLSERLKLGLAPFVANTELANQFTVNYTNGHSFKRESTEDPWKNWVFELYGGANFRMEETQNSLNARYGFYADKISEDWKIRIRPYFNYNERNFITEEETITSKSRRDGFVGYAIRSLNQHWSTGLFSSILSSTFHNMRFGVDIGPGIEYSIFPYNEATSRAVTFAYKVAFANSNYIEETIFEKEYENLLMHSIRASVRYQQTWGSIRAGLLGSHYFHNFDANRLEFYSSINLKVFNGFSLNLSGNFDLTRDLLAIPKGDLSIEEILLQQRRQASNYQVYWSVGLAYTFGSSYQNVVNTRF